LRSLETTRAATGGTALTAVETMTAPNTYSANWLFQPVNPPSILLNHSMKKGGHFPIAELACQGTSGLSCRRAGTDPAHPKDRRILETVMVLAGWCQVYAGGAHS
jgi:hypothetical protein